MDFKIVKDEFTAECGKLEGRAANWKVCFTLGGGGGKQGILPGGKQGILPGGKLESLPYIRLEMAAA